jgi:hypothetical protein
MYSIGFDPATRNLGVAIVDKKTYECSLQIVDLFHWGENKYKITERLLGQLICSFLMTLDDMFKKTTHCFIENQPPFGRPIIKLVQRFLEQAVRFRYPHVIVVRISMSSVRVYFKTKAMIRSDNQNEQHELNKIASSKIDSNVLEPSEMLRAISLFKISKKAKVDGIEALQICVYGMNHLEKHKIFNWKEKREFKSTKMLSNVSKLFQQNTK